MNKFQILNKDGKAITMAEQEKEEYLYEYVDAFAEALAKLGEH